MMRRDFRGLAGLVVGAAAIGLLVAGSRLASDEKAASPVQAASALAAVGQEYERHARPIIQRYCLECHSTKTREGELDLERFATLADVRKDSGAWQKVAEMLDQGEMPPKEVRQPSGDERRVLRDWVRRYLEAEGQANAGDPGRVVFRRLSNAEYTYTVRDLTGMATLEPAREFPVDGAAGEGFTNTGAALAMSPALFSKYLDAAKGIAAHAVLLPDGIRFSPKTTRRDWTDEIVTGIREFYRPFVDPSGATRVHLQGLVWDTNHGGRLPLEKYLAALLAERDAIAANRKSVDAVARERGLSAKYLRMVWETLSNSTPSLLLDPLRARFRAAKPGDAATLSAEVARWQQALWKFSSVGHIGKVGGPKAWMEPISPLAAQQELRLPLPAPSDGKPVTVFLVAGDAGDGNEHDFVVWEKPRLVAKGRADVPLRDVRGALDPARFGRHPDGGAIEGDSLRVQAPGVIALRLPADVAKGSEFVTTGKLDERTGREGSVQLEMFLTRPTAERSLIAPAVTETSRDGPWTSNNRGVSHATPIIVGDGSAARRRMESAIELFRQVFPPALCYTRIVPVDEVVTLTLYYREDDQLRRLMLDDEQAAQLDRLWDELHYVSHDALTLVDAFAQLMEYATQDADPKVFEPLRKPIHERAAAFKKRLVETEPRHVDAMLEFAARAYRRPLTASESSELRGLYNRLRKQNVPHDEAIRLTLARILVAPAFLYKLEQPGPGAEAAPVSDWELATRLSYFLWSSSPDDELRAAAASGRLREPAVLASQTRRMLRDPRIRRLATEFACQWLHIHDFAALDEKSERHFPTFNSLRGAMYEETIRFFTDLFQRDGTVWEILDADHTFLNEALARHYDIPGVLGGEWRRVVGVKRFDRGGILGQASILAKQSGASRTSPILRGNWISEVLLGEKLPRPPKDVPQLPQDESDTQGLTVRELVVKHSADPKCAVCHRRIDAYGLALESFDAIGRRRHKDLGGRPIDNHATAIDGAQFEGLSGLRGYLLTTRREAFVRQFCRKLLGYALGRSVQLSDEPLLREMKEMLSTPEGRVGRAIEPIVLSRQFREIRGRQALTED
jgi:hypothetical protein